MVEIEQEELDLIKSKAEQYDVLKAEHDKLVAEHNTLKDDYISLSKGQHEDEMKSVDYFAEYCKKRYGK